MSSFAPNTAAVVLAVGEPVVVAAGGDQANVPESPRVDRAELSPRTAATMDLILWRHAEAEPGEPDHGRRLTAKGLRQAERVGAWLEHRLPEGARVLVSPAMSAQQTAMALGRKFRITDAVGPDASVAGILAAAGWPDAGKPVVVVGHQPMLGGVASFLLSGEEASWTIRKGALWWVSNRKRGGASGVVLRAMVGPDIA